MLSKDAPEQLCSACCRCSNKAGMPSGPSLWLSWVQVKPGHSKGMSWGYLLTTAVMTAAPRPKPYSQVLPVITQMEPSPHIRTCECNWWHTDQCCEELFPGDEQETILTIKHNRPHSRPHGPSSGLSLCVWAKFMESPQRPLQKRHHTMLRCWFYESRTSPKCWQKSAKD